MVTTLYPLSDLPKTGSDNLGGKAANLSILMSAGFPVPQGFVITADAYEAFLAENGLKEQISECLASTDFDDEASLRLCSARVKGLITSSPISPLLSEAVSKALLDAGSGKLWAVRSSAIAEDLAEASFAGQQDTYLNVGEPELADRITCCWASYWNERAIAYRHNAGIPHLDHGIAVVIQMMVNAASSGVMFTSDPVSGKKDEIVVESSWGLGEAIVSGLVSPDRFSLDKRTLKPTQKKINRKLKGIFQSEGRSSTLDIEEPKQLAPSISDGELKALAGLGIRIEERFGAPQDIEWSIEGGNIFVLQSRPITTLGKCKETLWTRAYGDEYWADVTSPLFFSLLGEYLSKYVLEEGYLVMGYWELQGLELLKLHKGHIYFNSAVLEAVFTFNPKFSRTKELLNYFPESDQERIANAKTKVLRRLWSEVRIAFKDRDGMITRTYKAYDKWAAGFLEKMKRYDALDLAKLSNEELCDEYRDMVAAFLKHYRLIRYGMVTHSIGMNLFIKRWLVDWLDDRSGALYSSLVSGLPDNKTIKTNNALVVLARSARDDPKVASALRDQPSKQFHSELRSNPDLKDFGSKFDAFLRDYGHRSHTRELYFPRWADDPSLVVDILKSLAAAPDIDVEKLEKEKAEKRKATEKDILQRVSKLRFGFFKKIIFKTVMNYAQIYLQFRENQRFYLDHTLYRERRLFMEFGRRFAEQGITSRQDDVFFLSKEEVFATSRNQLPDIKKQIAERRKEFDRYSDKLPPKFLKGKMEFDDTVVYDADALKITGTSASPGIAMGTVRVVESIGELSQVESGEILVTSNTDPGWTPVFSKLGGLITETGGILSHGAVVSREYGIPAVTAVKNAKQIFRTGQKVTVDGNDGIVYIMKE